MHHIASILMSLRLLKTFRKEFLFNIGKYILIKVKEKLFRDSFQLHILAKVYRICSGKPNF